MPMSDTGITVVTVLHNSARVLRGLLASLTEDVEVIVVDSGSADDGAAVARAAGAEVVCRPDNPGFGAANNVGVARASRDVTILMNPDCEAPPRSLQVLADLARAADALHVPRLVGADGVTQRSAHPLPGTWGALAAALVHPPLLPAPLRDRVEPYRASRSRTVGWAIAACVAARTSTLRRLGPFDPAQFLFYEDMDLCLRARAAAVPTVFHPQIAVRHLGGHATEPAYGGEPYAMLAQRRSTVVEARRGRAARRRDDLAQTLTFATRTLAARPQAFARLRAQIGTSSDQNGR